MIDFYLASPYSNDSEAIREARAKHAMEASVFLSILGFSVFSPIVHWHEASKRFKLPQDFEFWKKQCLDSLEASKCMLILELPGWAVSKGIVAEMYFAGKNGIPVKTITMPAVRQNNPGTRDELASYLK